MRVRGPPTAGHGWRPPGVSDADGYSASRPGPRHSRAQTRKSATKGTARPRSTGSRLQDGPGSSEPNSGSPWPPPCRSGEVSAILSLVVPLSDESQRSGGSAPAREAEQFGEGNRLDLRAVELAVSFGRDNPPGVGMGGQCTLKVRHQHHVPAPWVAAVPSASSVSLAITSAMLWTTIPGLRFTASATGRQPGYVRRARSRFEPVSQFHCE